MPAAHLRKNEAASLKVLHELGLLDTAPEPEYDGLVRAAAQACKVPMALITLLDEDRQWFKANFGMTDCVQTPREDAFCAYAVLDSEILEVSDTLADRRFRDNPLVTGSPNIRFYAGAPLSIANGLQIGTLCVLDTVPRQLTADERLLLKAIATAASHSMELHLARRRLRALMIPRAARDASVSELVVDAKGTVEVAVERLFENDVEVPFTPESELTALSEAESARIAALEKSAYQARPAMAAVHLCLTASSTLLGITTDLLHSAQYMTPEDRERAWNKLAADTKSAGRAAYRAALVLADPDADRDLVATAQAPLEQGGHAPS